MTRCCYAVIPSVMFILLPLWSLDSHARMKIWETRLRLKRSTWEDRVNELLFDYAVFTHTYLTAPVTLPLLFVYARRHWSEQINWLPTMSWFFIFVNVWDFWSDTRAANTGYMKHILSPHLQFSFEIIWAFVLKPWRNGICLWLFLRFPSGN